MDNFEEASKKIHEEVEKYHWPRIEKHIKTGILADKSCLRVKVPTAVLKRDGIQMRIVDKASKNFQPTSIPLERQLIDNAVFQKLIEFCKKEFLKRYSLDKNCIPISLMTYEKSDTSYLAIDMSNLKLEPSHTGSMSNKSKRGPRKKIDSLKIPPELIPVIYELVFHEVKTTVSDNRKRRYLISNKNKKVWERKRIGDIKSVCDKFSVNFSETELSQLGTYKRSDIAENIVRKILNLSPRTLNRYLPELRRRSNQEKLNH
jgi:hypothetical protein